MLYSSKIKAIAIEIKYTNNVKHNEHRKTFLTPNFDPSPAILPTNPFTMIDIEKFINLNTKPI